MKKKYFQIIKKKNRREKIYLFRKTSTVESTKKINIEHIFVYEYMLQMVKNIKIKNKNIKNNFPKK